MAGFLTESDLNLLTSKLSVSSPKKHQQTTSSPKPRSTSVTPSKKHYIFVQEQFSPAAGSDDVYFQVYEDTEDEESDDSFVTASASSVSSPESITTTDKVSSTCSSFQSSPCPEKEPVVEPLHQKISHKMLLQKKLAEKKNIASPTDNMMSPCSQKLRDYKAKKGSKAPNALLVRSFMKKKTSANELGTGKENEKTPLPVPEPKEEPKADADDVF